MTAIRYLVKTTVDVEQGRIRSSLNQFCELQKVAPNNLEIRTIDYLLGHFVFLLDPGSDHGVAYVERYSFKAPLGVGVLKAKSVYRQGEDYMYELVLSETRQLLNSGVLWECPALGQ